ncbi:phage tail assembly chaperone [Roseospira visakhapatnamensis]
MHIEDGEDPPPICIPPPVSPALARYVVCFRLVTRDRPVGMAPGPIPTSAIITYARDVDGVTDRAELRRYLRFVGTIDEEYLRAGHTERREKGAD